MPDFIYTLDSEPESDIELDAPAAAIVAPSIDSVGPSSASGANKTKPKSAKTTSGITKSKSKPTKFSSKKNDDDDGEGEEEDGPAPTIDPSFNFDLTGGGASFFDGLGGGEEDGFGMREDEVRSGTKPVRSHRRFSRSLLCPFMCGLLCYEETGLVYSGIYGYYLSFTL